MTIADEQILSVAIGGFTTLGTVIAVMWRSLKRENELLRKRSDECEEDRKSMWAKISELSGLAALLERCPSDDCPQREFGKTFSFTKRKDKKP